MSLCHMRNCRETVTSYEEPSGDGGVIRGTAGRWWRHMTYDELPGDRDIIRGTLGRRWRHMRNCREMVKSYDELSGDGDGIWKTAGSQRRHMRNCWETLTSYKEQTRDGIRHMRSCRKTVTSYEELLGDADVIWETAARWWCYQTKGTTNMWIKQVSYIIWGTAGELMSYRVLL